MNSVSAAVTTTRPRPSIRVRRTALTFDDAGAAVRVGGVPRVDSAVTDFADLARDPEPLLLGGRLYTAPGLVATVLRELIGGTEAVAGAVLTYPAVYSDKQVALLRQALDLSGAREVMLVPEPVAAAEWLAHEHGPLESGFVLVYDLGATSLDVTVVRVGPDWPDHPIVGNPRRCYDFGGRPLGTMLARYSRGAVTGSVSLTSLVDVDGLRAEHVRDSFEVVRAAVRSTGRSLSDIDRVLVVGGAARPPEVAATLAELGRPVVTAADPAHITAAGAAHFAARVFAPELGESHSARGVVFSGAAVASAIAVSAATVLGGTAEPVLAPVLQRFPELPVPLEALPHASYTGAVVDHGVRHGVPLGLTQPVAGLTRNPHGRYAATATDRPAGPTIAESRRGAHNDPRTERYPALYADPAHFTNPLPFGWATLDSEWERPTPPSPAPGTNTPPAQPGSGPAPGQPATGPAQGTPVSDPGVPAPGGAQPSAPAAGGSVPAGTEAAPGTGADGTAETNTGGDQPGSGAASDGGGAEGAPGSDGASSGGASGGTTDGSGGASSGGESSGDASGGGSGAADSGGSDGGSAGAGSGGSGGASSGAGGGSGGGTSAGGSGGSGGESSGGTPGDRNGSGASSSGTSSKGSDSGGAGSGGGSKSGGGKGGGKGGGGKSDGGSRSGGGNGGSGGGSGDR
ncbi:Hsp70 family protein [Nocardia farcinica]|uniref:Hsp70 family protein n=1 Tax=Nocardia farcinica TaxID=37329 RepID=UPI00131AD902|nr:Hsp70 family protein [Nocardia farcinica]MBF6268023.1 Hsp70 family protein [Nocardia farcinica]MCZ9328033.1 Hsp70 family protein [Nocardia farcinica]